MITLGSAGARREYILTEDRDSETPTIFVLRRLTSEQLVRVVELSPMPIHVAMQVQAIHGRASSEAREITDDERAEIERLMPADEDAVRTARNARQMREATRFGLVEIRNVVDESGKPAVVAPNDFVERCDRLEWLFELGNAVIEFSSLREPDRKN